MPGLFLKTPPGGIGPTAALNIHRCTLSASLEPLPVLLLACVYCRCIVVSASSPYLSLQPERPHLDYTRRGLPRALKGFCLLVFPQKLSSSTLAQGQRAFLSLNPILSLSLSFLSRNKLLYSLFFSPLHFNGGFLLKSTNAQMHPH